MNAVAVIGGGPSGIMAAITAAEGGAAAVVFDSAAPLATILRTGGGRCNLSNAVSDPRQLAAGYPRGGKFLLSVFSRFGVPETLEWFRSRGLPLVVEEEGRVFPASGKAADVRDLLLRESRRLGVRLRGGTAVRLIERVGEGFRLATGGPGGRPKAGEAFSAVVLATGGDWRNPSGSGYRLAASLGHSITRLAPSLTGLHVSEPWPRSLAGLTLADVQARAHWDGRKAADERGDLLFTHRGISGPLAFRISARSAFLPFSPRAPLALTLSLVPDRRPARLEEEIQSAMSAHPRQAVATALGRYAPRSLCLALLALAGDRCREELLAGLQVGARKDRGASLRGSGVGDGARGADRHGLGRRGRPRRGDAVDNGVAARARPVLLRRGAGHRRVHGGIQPPGRLVHGTARRARRSRLTGQQCRSRRGYAQLLVSHVPES